MLYKKYIFESIAQSIYIFWINISLKNLIYSNLNKQTKKLCVYEHVYFFDFTYNLVTWSMVFNVYRCQDFIRY